MQVLIDIPDKQYNYIKKQVEIGVVNPLKVAVYKGTPLPENYGDLVDRDEINNRFNAICDELESLSNAPSYKELLDKLSMCLDTVKPVIENNYEDAEEELWK